MGLSYSALGDSGFPFEFISQFIPHGYTTCVETGTYYGSTAIQLSKLFKKTYTIEASKKFYTQAQEKLSSYPNIISEFGSSQIVLPRILKENENALIVFWLDAHYSGGETFQSQCPLLEEISAINELCKAPIIVIDDARFINMKYNDEARYAELHEFIPLLHNSNRYISCFDDKYIAVPQGFKDQLDACTQKNSIIDNRSLSEAQKLNSNCIRRFLAMLQR